MKKNWYAIYTKSHCEIKVAALLTKKKIENYCPLNRVASNQLNKNKIIYETLFPSFVFVHCSDTEKDIVKQTSSVINFVYWLGKPVIVKDLEIENIKHFTKQYENIKLEKVSVMGNNVRIINNTPTDINNNTISVKGSSCRLLLPSLGYSLMAEVGKGVTDVFNYSFDINKIVS